MGNRYSCKAMVRGQGPVDDVCCFIDGTIDLSTLEKRLNNALEYAIYEEINKKLEGYLNEDSYRREGELQEES